MTYLKTVEIIFPNDSDSQLATITSPSGLEHQRLSFEIFKGQQAVRFLASEEGKWTVRLGDVIQSVEVLGGDEAFLIFYDIRTPSRDFLDLPETATYRVEVIDTWEMTRTVVREHVTGRTEIKLPNKEGMAVLAVKNN